MTRINILVDDDLLKEFQEQLGREPLTKAIPRIIKKYVGWSEDHLECEVKTLKDTIDNLQSELSIKEENLVKQLSDKLNYLVEMEAKSMWPDRHPTWEGDHDVIPTFKRKGITWHFLYDHWEEF